MHFRNLEFYNVKNDNAFGSGADLYHASAEIKVANSLSCCISIISSSEKMLYSFIIFFFKSSNSFKITNLTIPQFFYTSYWIDK